MHRRLVMTMDHGGRLMRDAGQPPAFQGHTRRQALPVIRVAACLDSCGAGIARLSRPPHPPTTKAPPNQGKPQEGGGAGDRFLQCRRVGARAITCGSGVSKHRNPRGCKAAARFGPVDIPQVTPFSPRVGAFFPHLPFCGFGPLSLSFLSFLEERERREGGGAGKRASTGLKICKHVCPQVGAAIHGFSVDGVGAGIVIWRGFARGWGGNPRSTGGNACVPPFVLLSGGLHGAHGMD